MTLLNFFPKVPAGNTYGMLISTDSARNSNKSFSQAVAAALSAALQLRQPQSPPGSGAFQ
jgi:hypothetical protein